MKNKYYLLVFIYWLILAFVLEGLFHFFSTYRFLNVLENTCFIALSIFIIGSIPNKAFKRKLFNCFIVLMVIMLWFETIMYYHFKISFGPSSFYVVLNTNQDEFIEFTNEYIDFTTFLITILFFVPLIKLKFIVSGVLELTSTFRFKRFKWVKLIGVTLIVLFVFKASNLIDHNLPYLVGRSLIKNYKDTQWIDKFNTQINNSTKLIANTNTDTKNTFIVVIGESTTSEHMQVYGYYRETTPALVKQKDSILLYKDVISPNTSTFHSLSKALTLGNYENPKKVLALPITTLFNKAGFKTFWISNHSPAFNPSSALARVSNQAQSKFFNSKVVVMNNLKHDGELLSKVDEALKDDFPHKIIFLHLIGTHFSYTNRYPNEFDIFKTIPKTQFITQLAYDKINQYDNAVRYADFILNQILEKLKAEKDNSYLMFFSDHGEEVFQEDNFYGHLEDRPTKNTFKIPFIMWYSNNFKYPKGYIFDENRKYMTDDLWHSIAYISGLESSFIEKERSIFSVEFLKRKRVILKDKTYESYFNE